MKIQEDFITMRRNTITFGPAKVIGIIENNARSNLMKVISLKDAKNITHTSHNQSLILYGDTIPSSGGVINAEIQLSPAVSGHIPGNSDARFKLFFSNIIGYGKIISFNYQPLANFNFLQASLINKVDSKFKGQVRGFIYAILFGNSSETDQNFYDKMVNLGISHLLVVSAMHFIFFSYIFCFIARWIIAPLLIRCNFKMQNYSKYALLVSSMAYLLIVKQNWSVIRSFLTIFITILLSICQARLKSWQTTCLTLLIMIFVWPYAIFELGFQLSFLSVFTLVLLECNFITATLYVNLITMPFILYNHGYINLQPFIASSICIPFFSFIIMPLLSLSTVLYFPDQLLPLLNWSINFFIWLVEKLNALWIIPINHYLTTASLCFFILSLFCWVLIRSLGLFLFLNFLSIVFCKKSNYPTILIDLDLKTIFYYKDRVLYTNQPESWKAKSSARFFNANRITRFNEDVQSNKISSINKCSVIFDKHERFNELNLNGTTLVKAWDLIGNRSSVLIIFKSKYIIIKFNNDKIKLNN